MERSPSDKKNRSVKAVSPVIANVMMAAAVITVGMVALTWATSTFYSHQSGAGAFLLSRREAMKESRVIEDIWFYEGSGKRVNVTVRNVGSVNLTIAAIYLKNSTHEEIWEGSQMIEVGKAITIEIPFSWDTGQYTIVVATARGNQVRDCYNTSG